MDDSKIKFDVIIIGAGIVGCAVAERLSRKNLKICVFEKEARIADGVTSRNSGVIHAGIYYPPDSLKAKLCIRGNQLLYEWCVDNKVPHLKTGKLIVLNDRAAEEEFEGIYQNALSSGVRSLKKLSATETQMKESHLKALASLYSPETGIVDPFEFSRSLLLKAESRGCLTLLKHPVKNLQRVGENYEFNFEDFSVQSPVVINAAGLYSDEICRFLGIDKYQIYPYRGNYFRLQAPFKFRHLIYPVRKKTDAGLGVHLTLDLLGGMRLGPDIEMNPSKDDFSDRPQHLESFRVAAEKLLGLPLSASQLSYDTCGIRPKLRAPTDKEEKDFVISGDAKGLINLVGIESPGLTASMAIAELVDQLLS